MKTQVKGRVEEMDVDKIPDKWPRVGGGSVSVQDPTNRHWGHIQPPKLASLTYQPDVPGPKFSSVPTGSLVTINTYPVCGHSIV